MELFYASGQAAQVLGIFDYAGEAERNQEGKQAELNVRQLFGALHKFQQEQ